MVTACGNLLDDEYKQTLDTDIPATGYRFRAVVDIMVSDRALFHVFMDAAIRQEIASDRVLAAATASIVSLSVEAGRFAAVIGISGAGKSTLLYCMGGFETPDRGEVLCFGTSIHRLFEVPQ